MNVAKTRVAAARALLLASAMTMPAMAFAQAIAPQTTETPQPQDNATPGDIVVTAQRRTQNLQDVPIQVTAIGAQTIEKAGIRNTADALVLVPNVSFDESFTYLNSFVTVRGISQINNADPPVAIVVDGVPQNNQKQARMDLFDIERVEVLKGPQGGLYGRNALGGAINIVTKQPSDRYAGFIEGSYGNGNAVDISAALSGPLVKDQLLFRVSASYKHDDGRIGSAFNPGNVDFVHHDYSVRGQLNYVGIDNLTLDLRGDYRNFSAGGIYDSVVASGNANDIQPPRSNIEGLTFGHVANASFKFDYDAGPVTLTGITSYSDIIENYRGDLDFSNPRDLPGGFLGLGFQAGQGQDLSVRQISQEVRLTSKDTGPFRWILGAYYLHTDRDLWTRAFVDLNGSRSQIDNPALRIINLQESNSNNAYAGYGQFDYDIVDGLTLSGALRYDRDNREQTNILTGAVRRRGFDSVQPKVTLTYKIDPRKLIYATYSTGFRSGGFNAPTVSIPLFKDETLQNYEAGFKTSWLNRRLVINGALYFERDKNYQFFFIDVATASQVIGNLDRVNIWGVELEAEALVTKQLQLSAAIGTTDTNIRRSALFPAAIGNHTPKTTPWSLNLAAQYTRPVTNDLDLVLRADFKHNARKYWQIDNIDVQKAINLVNLRAGLDGAHWSLYGFGRNVFNVKYYADYNPANFSGQAYDIGFRAQPATYGIEAKVKF
ncbi:MAG: TonB-dependent receptor [Candidatus Sphingomonas phytovorans]|nr:TonB-dependent receptor [Sphingomonas sp.]WEK00199.1 MAG: TonB-dependent receptor [Sphingomonas sp.]